MVVRREKSEGRSFARVKADAQQVGSGFRPEPVRVRVRVKVWVWGYR